MRFFTPAWHRMPERKRRQVARAYRQHLDGLLADAASLPVCCVANLNLHDGLIRRAVVDHRARTLRLELRCGDLQVGYADVDLSYTAVELGREDLSQLAAVAKGRYELLDDELDRANDKGLVHRFLFWPDDREFAVCFESVAVSVVPAADRTLPETRARFVQRGG